MTSGISTTGIRGNSYQSLLRKHVIKTKPTVFGLAVAYVSTSGFSLVNKIFEDGEVEQIRLVADIKDRVTHPRALRNAIDAGWEVKVVDNAHGTFHPKLYVGGEAFHDDEGVAGLSMSVTGSSNLSRGGFVKNGECSFWSVSPPERKSAAKAWKDCWDFGTPITPQLLADYEKSFAERNRKRSANDLVTLGVSDELPPKDGGKPRAGIRPPRTELKTISDNSASVAWAGLQSFTGEYNLQVEFPKEAGLVLRRVIGRVAADGSVEIACSDGELRAFRYRYYEHNGMFRLNIPNVVPLVAWAREHKEGIALVIHDDADDIVRFEIVPPSGAMIDIVDRSLAMGTWGRTPTRLYGWY